MASFRVRLPALTPSASDELIDEEMAGLQNMHSDANATKLSAQSALFGAFSAPHAPPGVREHVLWHLWRVSHAFCPNFTRCGRIVLMGLIPHHEKCNLPESPYQKNQTNDSAQSAVLPRYGWRAHHGTGLTLMYDELQVLSEPDLLYGNRWLIQLCTAGSQKFKLRDGSK